MLDSSIVNVAAPIARQLHAPLAEVGWAVGGYLLALDTGLAATSWLARRLGTPPACCSPPSPPRSPGGTGSVP